MRRHINVMKKSLQMKYTFPSTLFLGNILMFLERFSKVGTLFLTTVSSIMEKQKISELRSGMELDTETKAAFC